MAHRDSSLTSANGTSINAARPPGVPQAGDYIFAYLVTDIGLNGPAPTWTNIPSGWTLLQGSNQGVNSGVPDGFTSWVYWKLSAGNEPSTWTFGHNGSSTQIIAIVGSLSGRSIFPNFITHGTVNTTGNATPVTVSDAGVTSLYRDDILVFANGDITVGTDTWAFAPPASFTERQDGQLTFDVATLATRDGVTGGATGTLSLILTRSAGTGTAGWGIFVISVPVANPTTADIYLYPGEANPNDVKLRDPTVLDLVSGAISARTDGASLITGTLLATGSLISNASGISQTTENLTGIGALTGNVSGPSQSISNISAGISGNSFSSSQLQANLLGSAALTGRIIGQATSTENLLATGSLNARVDNYGTERGLADGLYLLQGSISGTSQSQATLLGAGQLTGRVAGSEFGNESLQGIFQLVASVTGSSQTTGVALGGFFMFGVCNGQGHSRLVITGSGELKGNVFGSEYGSQSLQGVGSMASRAGGSSHLTGSLIGAFFITGISNGYSQTRLLITGTGQMIGNVSGSGTPTGSLTSGFILMIGSVIGSSTLVGSLSATSQINATCFGYSFTRGIIFPKVEIESVRLKSRMVLNVRLKSPVILETKFFSTVRTDAKFTSPIETEVFINSQMRISKKIKSEIL